jgi:hypothetical protein
MSTLRLTNGEIRARGWEALIAALEPSGALRFAMQTERGHGDYAARRDRHLGHLSVDDLLSRMGRRRLAPDALVAGEPEHSSRAVSVHDRAGPAAAERDTSAAEGKFTASAPPATVVALREPVREKNSRRTAARRALTPDGSTSAPGAVEPVSHRSIGDARRIIRRPKSGSSGAR